VQVGPRGVHRRGVAGGAGADDDDVAGLGHVPAVSSDGWYSHNGS
jgi:hypothetical protein